MTLLRPLHGTIHPHPTFGARGKKGVRLYILPLTA